MRLRHPPAPVTLTTHSISFDNLGEVTELARGEFPAGEPLGRHFSVTRALPRILALLEETGLRATFFVEGLNTELYPDSLAAIAAAGHEVAYHGWCHEAWGALAPGEAAEILARGVAALDALGLRPAGFRPPGGELPDAAVLREHGFAYASPAGDGGPAVRDGLAIVPFAWPCVDAYHYLPRLAALRGAEAPHPPAELARVLDAALAAGGTSVAVFHAFLTEPDERFAVLRRHLERVRDGIASGALRCAPLREVAAHVSSSPCFR